MALCFLRLLPVKGQTMKTSYLTVQSITFLAVNCLLYVKATFYFHIANSSSLSRLHWASDKPNCRPAQRHTLSFNREASDKNHATICEYKDTFNKDSDSICLLISALSTFNVIKKLASSAVRRDHWDKFLFYIWDIYQSCNRALNVKLESKHTFWLEACSRVRVFSICLD